MDVQRSGLGSAGEHVRGAHLVLGVQGTCGSDAGRGPTAASLPADQRWQRGLRRGALGPRDHGRAGAGLQGGGRHPGPGSLAQGLVVGPQRREGGLVPGQLRQSESPARGGDGQTGHPRPQPPWGSGCGCGAQGTCLWPPPPSSGPQGRREGEPRAPPGPGAPPTGAACVPQLRVNQEELAEAPGGPAGEQPEEGAGRSRHKHPESPQQMRTNVIQEIMKTERVYIKHLRDICEVSVAPPPSADPAPPARPCPGRCSGRDAAQGCGTSRSTQLARACRASPGQGRRPFQ